MPIKINLKQQIFTDRVGNDRVKRITLKLIGLEARRSHGVALQFHIFKKNDEKRQLFNISLMINKLTIDFLIF